jgi:tetratricopeptide (TPR) repeat protein
MNSAMDPALPPRTLGGRFRLECEVGRGGMGTIYGARDLLTGGRVAVKVLHDDRPATTERFRHEAAMLADLRHPAIVRYVDHGISTAGEHYLAMEWLEGETLEQRLAGGKLGVVPAVRLAVRTLDALAFAHDRGVIHRDLKPANLFLPGGSLGEMKLLDFGVARRIFEGSRMTRTGSTVGTPLYMSPEQARGVRVLDARSDLFSLGALLVECLTGKPAFAGETPLAVMVKICMDTLDLGALCPDAPPALRDMLEAMLAKRPDDRPARAAELRDDFSRLQDALLAALATPAGLEPQPAEVAPARPTLTSEQRVLSAIVVAPPSAPPGTDDRTYETVAAAVEEFSGRVDRFAGGAMLITMRGGGTPGDQAIVAARCALKLRGRLPQAVLAVSTGRTMIGAELPVGELVDRASLLMERQRPGAVVVDPATSGLLESCFALEPGSGAEAGRLLFERPEPRGIEAEGDRPRLCVGRERELGTLLAIFDECVAEPVARAVLVSSPAGGGKSRLRQELVRRARARGHPFTLLLARGDSIRAGAPFGLLGPALRAAAGITEGEPQPLQRTRLRALAASVLPAEAARVAAFLGEMAGVPFADDELPALRSAREDPRVMADQVLLAWLDWLEAQCKAGPVVLVLEDLHWGDVPSVEFVDVALRTLSDRPLLVLGLSRPEVEGRFPGLWNERSLQRIGLAPLTPRSCRELVQQLAGDLEPARAEWVIERADGNAFYLEELVRAVVAGVDSESLNNLPDSVLGMVQARFDALGAEVRRVLRAASVFGQTFGADGVEALCPDGVPAALEVLEGREVILPRAGAGARQYVFRHALLREAAYEMLTEDDRRLAHGRAGAFLEERGERDAIVLVEHFERGGLGARAIEHCARAAAQALDANDLRSAIERVARGVANGAQGETLGAMRSLEAQAHFWCGDYAQDERAAREACALARGPARLHAMSELVAALGQMGRFAAIEPALAEARAWPEATRHPAAWQAVMLRACGYLPSGGHIEATQTLLREVESTSPADPSIRGQIHKARGLMGLAEGQPAGAARHFRASMAAFEAAGDARGVLEARCNLATAVASGGQLAEADQHLRELVATCDRMNLQAFEPMLLHNLGAVRADLGAIDEGRAYQQRALASARRQGDPRAQAYCLVNLALLAIHAGQFDLAETHAADPAARAVAALHPFALAALATALAGQGRVAEALIQAREANDELQRQGYVEDGEAYVRLSLVECLLAAGDRPAAAQAAARALHRLQDRAAALDDPSWRSSFLEAIPAHRRTAELATRLGAATPPAAAAG